MKKLIYVLISLFVFTQLNISCSDDSVEVDRIAYKGTQSPGDVWTWDLNRTDRTIEMTWDAGTFDDITDDVQITGSYIELPSKFLKVTLTNAVPASPEFPTDGSAFFYALEYENTALLVKPEGSIQGDIIMMVSEGNCSDLANTYNYIITAPGNGIAYDPIVEDAFGDVLFSNSGGGFNITGNKKSLDCLNGGACTEDSPINGVPTATCNGSGFLFIEDGGPTIAEGQFASAGVMMLDFGETNGGLFGLAQNSIVNTSSFNGSDFNGIGYFPNSVSDKTVPLKVSFNNTGVGTAYMYTSLESNLVDGSETISIIIDQVVDGLVTGSIEHTSGTTDFAAAAIETNGKLILVLSSTTDEVGDPPFILVLTSF